MSTKKVKRCLLGLLLISFAAVAFAEIQGAVDTANQPAGAQEAGDHTWTYRVTISGVDADEEKRFRDFHIYPRAGAEINVDSVSAPNGWKVKKADGGGVVVTSDGNNGNGNYDFSLIMHRGAKEAVSGDACDVVLTHTGKPKRETGDSFGTAVRNGPCHFASMSGGIPGGGPHWTDAYTIRKGETTTFALQLPGGLDAPYQVYHSIVSLEDWSDSLGLGIKSESDPVPPSWGLTFTDFTGALTNGEATCQVTVPNDPALVGNVFYLVAAQKNGGSIEQKAYDIKVTIIE